MPRAEPGPDRSDLDDSDPEDSDPEDPPADAPDDAPNTSSDEEQQTVPAARRSSAAAALERHDGDALSDGSSDEAPEQQTVPAARRSSTALDRASIEPQLGTPRDAGHTAEAANVAASGPAEARSVAGSVADSVATGIRSLRSSIGRVVDLGRLRQPVRDRPSRWRRRGRRVLTLFLASAGYALFLLNNGSLGDRAKPLDCAGLQQKGELWHCVRVGSAESCERTCDSRLNVTEDCGHRPEFMDRCTRRWVQNGTELCLMLSVLLLAYMAMLGELTLANAKEDDSGAIKQTKVKWGRVAGYIWTVLVLFLLLSLPAVFSSHTFRDRFQLSPQSVGQTSAMVFAVLAIMLSLREIMKHFLNWNSPTLQVHVVRVLFMVPVYAADAFGTLVVCSRTGGCENEDGSYNMLVLLLEVVREFYEAFTIFSFFRLLQEALRREADLRHSGDRDTALSPYDSLQDLGAGRSTFGNDDRLAPLLSGGQMPDGGGGGSRLGESLRRLSRTNSGDLIERMEQIVGVDELPEDLARLDTMIKLEVSDDARKHKWWGCMCCLKPWPAGYPWLMRCRRGVLQYVLVQIVCALAVVFSRHFDYYGEPGYGSSGVGDIGSYCGDANASHTDGSQDDGGGGGGGGGGAEGPAAGGGAESGGSSITTVDWAKVYPYTTIVISVSQLWALYCLIHFYYGTKQLLAQYDPGAKFVSIKLIVFFSFWQNMAITIWFSEMGTTWLRSSWIGFDNRGLVCWLNSEFQLSVGSFAAGGQALLICVEMFVASLVHRSVFSYRAFRPTSAGGGFQMPSERLGMMRTFLNVFQETDRMSSTQGSARSEAGRRRTNGSSTQGSARSEAGRRRAQHGYHNRLSGAGAGLPRSPGGAE
jgi:hypothetical protein